MPTPPELPLPVSFSWYEIIAGTTPGHGSCALANVAAVEASTHHPRPAVPHQSRRVLCDQPPRTSSVPRACRGAAGGEARGQGLPGPSDPNALFLPDLQGPKVGWTREDPRPWRLRSLPTVIQQVPVGQARGWRSAPRRGHSRLVTTVPSACFPFPACSLP